jgi:hypothetical protein
VFKVEIVEIATGKIEKSMEVQSERSAEQVERGVMINMNFDKYFTRIVRPEEQSDN